MSIIPPKLKYLTKHCFDLLLPPRCIVCNGAFKSNVLILNSFQHTNNYQLHICSYCVDIMPWLKSCCSICSNPLPETTTSKNEVCGQCLKHPPRFQNSTCLFIYKKPTSILITQLKFHHRLILAYHFGYLLAAKLKEHYAVHFPDILIPVPLHPQRLRQRGFNQALEIAKTIRRQLHISIDKTNLIRTRATRPQSEIPAKQRRSNMKNAFVCNSNLKNLHVLLIDDVITTGHTIDACCVALQKAGVKQIDVCAIARTNF